MAHLTPVKARLVKVSSVFELFIDFGDVVTGWSCSIVLVIVAASARIGSIDNYFLVGQGFVNRLVFSAYCR